MAGIRDLLVEVVGPASHCHDSGFCSGWREAMGDSSRGCGPSGLCFRRVPDWDPLWLTAVLRQVWQQGDLDSRAKSSNSRSGEVIGFWICILEVD